MKNAEKYRLDILNASALRNPKTIQFNKKQYKFASIKIVWYIFKIVVLKCYFKSLVWPAQINL